MRLKRIKALVPVVLAFLLALGACAAPVVALAPPAVTAVVEPRLVAPASSPVRPLEVQVVEALARAAAVAAYAEVEVTVNGRRWACIREPLDRLRAGDIPVATVWHVYVRDVTPMAGVKALVFGEVQR